MSVGLSEVARFCSGKKIRFSYKDRQNKFGGNDLLDLLILNLKVLH